MVIENIRKEFLKKLSKIPDERSQFVLFSSLCKGSIISSKLQENLTLIKEFYIIIKSDELETKNSEKNFDVLISLLLIYHNSRRINNFTQENEEEILNFLLHVLPALTKHFSYHDKYSIFFVRCFKKYLRLLKRNIFTILKNLRDLSGFELILQEIVSSDPNQTEEDYTNSKAHGLEQYLNLIYTLYSETLASQKIEKENYSSFLVEFDVVSNEFLWFLGQAANASNKVWNFSALIYGTENLLSFIRKNTISLLVEITKKLNEITDLNNPLELFEILLQKFKLNFNYYLNQAKDQKKFKEDKFLELSKLDKIRFISHLYNLLTVKTRDLVFSQENEFLWVCIEEALLMDDSQTKKIVSNLLEKMVQDEKEATKSLSGENIKKYLLGIDKCWSCFMNLYKTLDAFQVHLIKEIFGTIQTLVDELTKKILLDLSEARHKSKNIRFYQAKWLLSIILQKSANHNNATVTRYVVKSFLKLDINIDEVQELVYEKLFTILNIPMFYKDVDHQTDSKFFILLSDFFGKFYKKLNEEKIVFHAQKFLHSMVQRTKYTSTSLGLTLVLSKIHPNKIIFKKEHIALFLQMIKTFGAGYHLRRQNIFFGSLFKLIAFNTDHSELTLEDILIILDKFPIDLLSISYKEDVTKKLIRDILHVDSRDQQNDIFKKMLDEDFNYYHKLFIWIFLRFDVNKIVDALSDLKNLNFINNYYIIKNIKH